jgi:hypothetical protein
MFRRPAFAIIAAGLLIAAAPVVRSDPVGIYAVIDRVVVEPDSMYPQRVQLWGVFMLSTGQPGDLYQTPQRGYLYYSLGANLTAAHAEWNDLRSMAGTGRPVGFGGRYEKLGRVRRAGEAPASPDVYPRSYMGVVKMLTAHLGPDIGHELMRVPTPMSPADGGRVAPGQTRLVTRNVADTAVSYVFEIEGPGGAREASDPIRPGRGETSWQPRLALRDGQSYTWRVRATQGKWQGHPASATFTVGGR